MADPLSISILRKKQAQILATITEYEKKLEACRRDLMHVNAALALFNPSGEPREWRRYIDLHRLFKRGEIAVFCIECIRKEGPLDTRQLALRVIQHKGLDETDNVLRRSMVYKLIQVLRVHAKARRLDGTQKRDGVCVWKLVEDGQSTIRSPQRGIAPRLVKGG